MIEYKDYAKFENLSELSEAIEIGLDIEFILYGERYNISWRDDEPFIILQFYLADIMIDVSIITEAEPDTRFVWMVRDMGTHLAVIGKENCDEYVDAVRNSWGNVRMYLIHKRKLTGDGQTYTIHRLTEKNIRPVQIKHQDKIDMLKALALYARNSIDCIRANKELMNTDTKEYLQELDKTMQELPIRDSKKCTIA